MFSDSDEGGGDRRWSELRTDLLAVDERTPGWLPDIKLAALLRTNMQVGVQSMQGIFPLQKSFSVWRDGEARDRDAGHL